VVSWYILWSVGIFCGQLVYFVVSWYILWSFGTLCGHLGHFMAFWYIFPILECCTKKNLATLQFCWRRQVLSSEEELSKTFKKVAGFIVASSGNNC
jgi:hypothetical protein